VAEFRLLHASDLHFASRASQIPWWEPKAFKALPRTEWVSAVSSARSFDRDIAQKLRIQFLQRLSDVDAIVITGDIATTGSRVDLDVAKDYFLGGRQFWESKLAEVNTASLVQSSRMVFMPGNHDRFAPPLLGPTSHEFESDTHFGNDWTAGQSTADIEFGFVRSTEVKVQECSLVICSIDLALESSDQANERFGTWGQGIVTERRLRALRLSTIKHRQTRKEVIWAIHFAPAFEGRKSATSLIGEAGLIDLAKEMNVRLILCGHEHMSRWYKVPNTETWALCAGTALSYREPENSYLELSLEIAEESVTRCSVIRHRWNRTAGSWNEEAAAQLF
jgi:3',5'-cyclic AMP phosphodiesterase CpdA